ncbi:MAG: radical SAM protein [Rectinemataceae bacterium]|nr:radical SAM protein [Rectinemataceae bacterium]
MFDSCGRNIHYLRISVTDRCNLRCVYCMPADGVRLLSHDKILSYEQMTEVARAAAELGFDKIRITGGEPLARKGIAVFVAMLRTIPGIRTLGMTTNGTLLAPVAAELKSAGLDSVNVSLDTMDPGRYRELTRGGEIGEAIHGIETAIRLGFPVKLNVVVPDDGAEADLEAVREYAGRIGAGVQTIARYRLSDIKTDGGDYDRPPRCGDCNRLRLLANGMLRPCLHGEAEFPVDFANIGESIERAIGAKPVRGQTCTDLEVGQIGG